MTGKGEILAVKLPPKLRDKVRQAAKDGDYLNESEFAREAIRKEIERKDIVLGISSQAKKEEAEKGREAENKGPLASCHDPRR